MRRYNNYKKSGLDYLGEIPSHWSTINFRQVISVLTDFTANGSFGDLAKYVKYVDVPSYARLIRLTDIRKKFQNKGVYLGKSSYDYLSKSSLVGGELLIANVGAYAGYSYVMPEMNEKCSLGPNMLLLILSERLNVFFAQYLLNSARFNGVLTSMALSAAQPKLNKEDIRSLPVIVPPREEQDQITAYLNQKTAQIDRAIAQKERLIELLRERKQIVIQQAVTRGLDPTVEMKGSGVEWVGEVPGHWEVRRLKQLARIRYGLGQPPRLLKGGLPVIRATNVERGIIVKKGMIYADPEDIPWERNPTLRYGDLIVVRSGAYTGDSAMVTQEYDGNIAGYDMVASPIGIDPEYLANAMLSKYILYDQLYLLRMRAAQPHLNAEELGETSIICPPLPEQEKIVEFLVELTNKTTNAIHLHTQQIKKLKEYRTVLIDAAVTGKIKITG